MEEKFCCGMILKCLGDGTGQEKKERAQLYGATVHSTWIAAEHHIVHIGKVNNSQIHHGERRVASSADAAAHSVS